MNPHYHNKKLGCILLVDDDEATNYLNAMIVREKGIAEQVTVMESAGTALRYLSDCNLPQQSKNHPLPELIFLDINMPVMSGWEFLKEYDKLGLFSQKPILVMLTSSPNPDDESKARTFPVVSEYRRKPLSEHMLDEIMNQYFNGK